MYAKSILIIIDFIHRINPHCGLIMSDIVIGPNPLLRIGQKTIVIGRIRSQTQQLIKRPRNIIKVELPTQIEKSALPVKIHFTCARTCINKGD